MAISDQVPHTDTDDADLVRACLRKRPYPTEAVARLAVDTVQASDPTAQVRAYGCRRCGQWHVGGVPRAEQVFLEAAAADSSFDAERDRRRSSPTRERRRAYGEGYRRPRALRPLRRRDRDEELA